MNLIFTLSKKSSSLQQKLVEILFLALYSFVDQFPWTRFSWNSENETQNKSEKCPAYCLKLGAPMRYFLGTNKKLLDIFCEWRVFFFNWQKNLWDNPSQNNKPSSFHVFRPHTQKDLQNLVLRRSVFDEKLSDYYFPWIVCLENYDAYFTHKITPSFYFKLWYF